MIVEVAELILCMLQGSVELGGALSQRVIEEVDRVAQLLDRDTQPMQHVDGRRHDHLVREHRLVTTQENARREVAHQHPMIVAVRTGLGDGPRRTATDLLEETARIVRAHHGA